ncbi:hypothetical protein GCM10009867_16150 [Pedococcus aerophilus]|uniref:Secreted protein n=1 Tax=Pedococcus aerophilus TaxID=436356 RepID=A0ABN3UL33_9MICO
MLTVVAAFAEVIASVPEPAVTRAAVPPTRTVLRLISMVLFPLWSVGGGCCGGAVVVRRDARSGRRGRGMGSTTRQAWRTRRDGGHVRSVVPRVGADVAARQ